MKLNPATEILLSAAFVLTPKEHWTKGSWQRTVDGHIVGVRNPRACMFCLDGAIDCAAHDLKLGKHKRAAKGLVQTVLGEYSNIISFNDSIRREHAEILNALYRAAELSEAA